MQVILLHFRNTDSEKFPYITNTLDVLPDSYSEVMMINFDLMLNQQGV